ncbi:hypothetical protein RKD20_001920 [Streptomyces sp. SLBN-8D4]|jgi:hypothetical protein
MAPGSERHPLREVSAACPAFSADDVSSPPGQVRPSVSERPVPPRPTTSASTTSSRRTPSSPTSYSSRPSRTSSAGAGRAGSALQARRVLEAAHAVPGPAGRLGRRLGDRLVVPARRRRRPLPVLAVRPEVRLGPGGQTRRAGRAVRAWQQLAARAGDQPERPGGRTRGPTETARRRGRGGPTGAAGVHIAGGPGPPELTRPVAAGPADPAPADPALAPAPWRRPRPSAVAPAPAPRLHGWRPSAPGRARAVWCWCSGRR